MEKSHKVLCDYKQFLIDSFESNGISVKVFVFDKPKNIKRYCRETGVKFRDAFEKANLK